MPEESSETGKLFVPYPPLVKEVSEDGLFTVKKLEVAGDDGKLVTVVVGEKIDTFTPSKIIIQRKGGTTEFATIRGMVDTEEQTIRVKRGGKFEIGTQAVDSVLDMIGTLERERKPGETDIETEIGRFRKHLEENKDIVDKSMPAIKKKIIENIPNVIAPNVQLPSTTDPLTVLRKLRDEKYKEDIIVDVNDTVETLAEKIARKFIEDKVKFVERMIKSRRLTLEEAWAYAEAVQKKEVKPEEAEQNVETRYKVGDKIKINKGMDPQSEFGVKEPKVVPGTIISREDETFEVKYRYSDRYIVISTKDKVEFEVTDDMIESKAGEVARPKAKPAIPVAVPSGPVTITTTPPWNALDAKQQQAWQMVVDAIMNEGVPPANVVSIDMVENRVKRDAYYTAVVYEKGGSFYAGPMYGGYGSTPNTSNISTYANVGAAKKYAGSKIVEKTTKANQADRYQAVARYERPPAGYSPPAGQAQAQQTGKTYLRLVLWAPYATTEKVMSDNRKMREHLKERINYHLRNHRTASKTAGKGKDNPHKRDFLWQILDEDANQADLKNLESWAISEGMKSRLEVVSSPSDFVPVLPPKAKTQTMPAPRVSDTDKRTYAAIVGGALLGGVAGLLLKGEFNDKGQ